MKVASRISLAASRISLAAAALSLGLMLSVNLQAQIILEPTTNDLDIYNYSNVACSSSACQPIPFAQMGDNGYNYDIMYTNSGAFKHEYAGQIGLTWVTDFEMPDWNIPYGSIAHWDLGASSAAGYTPLNEPNTETEKVYDPDVVQLEDQLYSIYYTVGGALTNNNFPGNGSFGSTHRVRFETFSATDVPLSSSNTEIQINLVANTSYTKNPNIDVSVVGDIAMVWEEQSVFESTNHVYAKAYDNTNGLSANIFDLDPTLFDYLFFYNPDVACTSLEDAGLPTGSNYVYITFIGINDPGSTPDLLVYEATIDEIRNGLTPSPTKLHLVQSLPNTANVSVADNQRDYLYRPRIAARPQPDGFLISQNGHEFSIVVPSLNSSPEFSTNIEQFTLAGTYASGFYNEQLTSTPFAIADIDCALNYEPAIDVNEEGYDMIWNNDLANYLSGYSPNLSATYSMNNPGCGVSGINYEQTILRKRANNTGLTMYPEYSKVPEQYVNWGVYSPSVAYDRHQIIGNSVGQQANSTMYGWHEDIYYQESHYRLSTYNNMYLKRDFASPFESFSEVTLLNENQYSIEANASVISASIYDINGSLMPLKTTNNIGNLSSVQVNLNNLAAGVYILTLETELGTENVKLIKL